MPPEVPPEVPPEEATFITLTHGTNTEEGIPDTRPYQCAYQYAAPSKRSTSDLTYSEQVSKSVSK